MSVKHTLVLLWVIFLSYKVVTTGCQVIWVNRNVTDSFRVGKDGCMNNQSLCTSSARCHSDGLCLCKTETPNYRNPVHHKKSHVSLHNDTYGCISNLTIRTSISGTKEKCQFGPFQVIAYDSNIEQEKEFTHDNKILKFLSCSLFNAKVKFPDNETEREVRWLNGSYVDLNASNTTLYFKWKKSVPELQGSIITFNLSCTLSNSTKHTTCLSAKILGMWKKGTTALPTSNERTSPSGVLSSTENDSRVIIIALAVAVPLVVLLSVIVRCKCKKKDSSFHFTSCQSGERTLSEMDGAWRQRKSEKQKGTSSMKPFRHTDSTLRGPNAYADIPAVDTLNTFGVHNNGGYLSLDSENVIVEASPCCEMANNEKSESKEANFSHDLSNETVYTRPKSDSQQALGNGTFHMKSDKFKEASSKSNPQFSSAEKIEKEINENNSEVNFATSDFKGMNVDNAKFNENKYETVSDILEKTRNKLNAKVSSTEFGYSQPDVNRNANEEIKTNDGGCESVSSLIDKKRKQENTNMYESGYAVPGELNEVKNEDNSDVANASSSYIKNSQPGVKMKIEDDASKEGIFNEYEIVSDLIGTKNKTQKNANNPASDFEYAIPDKRIKDTEATKEYDNKLSTEFGYSQPDVNRNANEEIKMNDGGYESVSSLIDQKRKQENAIMYESGYAVPEKQNEVKNEETVSDLMGTKNEKHVNNPASDFEYAIPDKRKKNTEATEDHDNKLSSEFGSSNPNVTRKLNDEDTSYESSRDSMETIKKDDHTNSLLSNYGYAIPDKNKNANTEILPDSVRSIDAHDAKIDGDKSGHLPRNIKRIEINGDLYAIPDKKVKK